MDTLFDVPPNLPLIASCLFLCLCPHFLSKASSRLTYLALLSDILLKGGTNVFEALLPSFLAFSFHLLHIVEEEEGRGCLQSISLYLLSSPSSPRFVSDPETDNRSVRSRLHFWGKVFASSFLVSSPPSRCLFPPALAAHFVNAHRVREEGRHS